MALWIAGEAALSVVVVAALGWAARRQDASDQRRRGLRMGQAMTVAVFFGIAMLHAGLTLGMGGGKLPVVILCLILAVIGAALGRVPPNALVGVRTPWSLSSRLAWDRSNRLAGRLFLAVGLIGLAAAMVVDLRASMTLITVSVLAAAAASAFESCRVWRTDPERRLV